MKMAIAGATGIIGSAILDEAVHRGHDVTAVVRDPARLRSGSGTPVAVAEACDVNALAAAFEGHDVIVHAVAPPREATDQQRIDFQTAATTALIAATKRASVRRFIAVGGAGTSEIAPGVKLMDSYLFPTKWLGGARSTALIRSLLRDDGTLDWTFISPPHIIEPGPRTGKYRTGTDNLLFDEASGRSFISVADYAVALVDEAENGAHLQQRFTVGT